MQILKQGDEYLLKGSEIVTLFSMNYFILNLDNNEKKREIEGFSLFLLETDREEKISITNTDTPVCNASCQLACFGHNFGIKLFK